MIVLKRFEINYENMTHSKLNDKVEFPFDIDLTEYTDKFLAKKDLLVMMEEKSISYDELSDEQKRT
jgi:hypothetical protein